MTIKTLYVDGGVIGHNPSGIGGTWAYAMVDDNDMRVSCASGWITPFDAKVTAVTNNLTEMLALIRGMEKLPHTFQGSICSDSAVTLGRVFWGWKWTNIPTWMHHRFQEARHRLLHFDKITAVQLDGHPTAAQLEAKIGKRGNPVSIHNVWCDKACVEIGQAYLKVMEPV